MIGSWRTAFRAASDAVVGLPPREVRTFLDLKCCTFGVRHLVTRRTRCDIASSLAAAPSLPCLLLSVMSNTISRRDAGQTACPCTHIDAARVRCL